MHAAYDHAMKAAEALGREEETKTRVGVMLVDRSSSSAFVRQVLQHVFPPRCETEGGVR